MTVIRNSEQRQRAEDLGLTIFGQSLTMNPDNYGPVVTDEAIAYINTGEIENLDILKQSVAKGTEKIAQARLEKNNQ